MARQLELGKRVVSQIPACLRLQQMRHANGGFVLAQVCTVQGGTLQHVGVTFQVRGGPAQRTAHADRAFGVSGAQGEMDVHRGSPAPAGDLPAPIEGDPVGKHHGINHAYRNIVRRRQQIEHLGQAVRADLEHDVGRMTQDPGVERAGSDLRQLQRPGNGEVIDRSDGPLPHVAAQLLVSGMEQEAVVDAKPPAAPFGLGQQDIAPGRIAAHGLFQQQMHARFQHQLSNGEMLIGRREHVHAVEPLRRQHLLDGVVHALCVVPTCEGCRASLAQVAHGHQPHPIKRGNGLCMVIGDIAGAHEANVVDPRVAHVCVIARSAAVRGGTEDDASRATRRCSMIRVRRPLSRLDQ